MAILDTFTALLPHLLDVDAWRKASGKSCSRLGLGSSLFPGDFPEWKGHFGAS